MVPSISEIILLLLIILCVFGLGRLGAISEAIGERRARRLARQHGARQVVDITPAQDEGAQALKTPSQSRVDTIDEAIIEPPGDDASNKPS